MYATLTPGRQTSQRYRQALSAPRVLITHARRHEQSAKVEETPSVQLRTPNLPPNDEATSRPLAISPQLEPKQRESEVNTVFLSQPITNVLLKYLDDLYKVFGFFASSVGRSHQHSSSQRQHSQCSCECHLQPHVQSGQDQGNATESDMKNEHESNDQPIDNEDGVSRVLQFDEEIVNHDNNKLHDASSDINMKKDTNSPSYIDLPPSLAALFPPMPPPSLSPTIPTLPNPSIPPSPATSSLSSLPPYPPLGSTLSSSFSSTLGSSSTYPIRSPMSRAQRMFPSLFDSPKPTQSASPSSSQSPSTPSFSSSSALQHSSHNPCPHCTCLHSSRILSTFLSPSLTLSMSIDGLRAFAINYGIVPQLLPSYAQLYALAGRVAEDYRRARQGLPPYPQPTSLAIPTHASHHNTSTASSTLSPLRPGKGQDMSLRSSVGSPFKVQLRLQAERQIATIKTKCQTPVQAEQMARRVAARQGLLSTPEHSGSRTPSRQSRLSEGPSSTNTHSSMMSAGINTTSAVKPVSTIPANAVPLSLDFSEFQTLLVRLSNLPLFHTLSQRCLPPIKPAKEPMGASGETSDNKIMDNSRSEVNIMNDEDDDTVKGLQAGRRLELLFMLLDESARQYNHMTAQQVAHSSTSSSNNTVWTSDQRSQSHSISMSRKLNNSTVGARPHEGERVGYSKGLALLPRLNWRGFMGITSLSKALAGGEGEEGEYEGGRGANISLSPLRFGGTVWRGAKEGMNTTDGDQILEARGANQVNRSNTDGILIEGTQGSLVEMGQREREKSGWLIDELTEPEGEDWERAKLWLDTKRKIGWSLGDIAARKYRDP